MKGLESSEALLRFVRDVMDGFNVIEVYIWILKKPMTLHNFALRYVR